MTIERARKRKRGGEVRGGTRQGVAEGEGEKMGKGGWEIGRATKTGVREM